MMQKFRPDREPSSDAGFTFIELVITILLLGILSSLALYSGNKTRKYSKHVRFSPSDSPSSNCFFCLPEKEIRRKPRGDCIPCSKLSKIKFKSNFTE